MILWLGGSCAAGKTTIARTIALRFDLAFYRIDAHGYEHRDRLDGSDATSKSYDERWLQPSPEQIAEEFAHASARIFPLIVQDTAQLPVLTVVEGPQLFPRTVAAAMSESDDALWLVSTEDFRRTALGARPGDAAKFTSDAARALEQRIARDNILISRIRGEAAEVGLPVIEVDGSRDLPAMTDLVAAHFASAIESRPRIRDGVMRQRIRRSENDAMIANVKAFLADLGPQAPTEPGPLPFTCECDRLGCECMVQRTPPEYEAIRATDPGLILAHALNHRYNKSARSSPPLP